MTENQYKIYLDDKLIGFSKLDKADAPMGVVFGRITFINDNYNYEYFKLYCTSNNFRIVTDFPQDKLIMTSDLPSIKVLNPNAVEISGLGTHIEGMDSDGFDVYIVGIDSEFYEKEFPNHIEHYNQMF